ncbi:hypothetical protein DFJ58DRAFT_744985 [Suillus subalutaceus]|uniref:uncharacterized protein n=1 Tax=Suillus subalutaceus TaxID=48586 RepID=UPI001B86789A|nr:uncharacterized protein DFJ58DRAFT_744985 [Suillus subalutaceus]KAG1857683.1 hypothetical protein DFJ58DRAFT_744985 [Suillus subalutaceus]
MELLTFLIDLLGVELQATSYIIPENPCPDQVPITQSDRFALKANPAVPTDEKDRERCVWWKANKRAYGILGQLFHRFVNPSQLPSPIQNEYGVFAEHFVTAFAPEIFKVYLHQVESSYMFHAAVH